ncbi:hypothetical protein [Phenylobacterium aquaticum]|nr:hypothetical protein [Phenylobacterium aquaticum]MCI3132709.1 hypothetical protein [Phenylobacterium aquaticum]
MESGQNSKKAHGAMTVLKNVAAFVLMAFVALVIVEVLKLKVIPHFLH